MSDSDAAKETNGDVRAVLDLVVSWRAARVWALDLLRTKLNLEEAREVLRPELRGHNPIHGTEFFYRTHGVGVDISKSGNRGGIDFDFDKKEPDSYRLREFMIKQFNDGCLNKKRYRHLLQRPEKYESAVEIALSLDMRSAQAIPRR